MLGTLPISGNDEVTFALLQIDGGQRGLVAPFGGEGEMREQVAALGWAWDEAGAGSMRHLKGAALRWGNGEARRPA